MIAAGSLFTSCVTNTEPQGIKDLREAKADYIESLSNLKKAEAEKVKAEAAYQDAMTAYKNAETALKEAEVKAAEIANSIADAKAKAAIDSTLAAAELAAVEAAKDLAIAEFELQKTLGDIAVWSEELTPAERIAIKVYTDAYAKYIEAEQAVRKAEADVYKADLKYAEYIQELKLDTARQSGIIEANVMLLNNLPDSGASKSDIDAFKAKYKQEKLNAEYALANINAEWNLYRQTEVAENIKGFAAELSEWVVKNAALPAPYAVHFKADLPDNDQVNGLFCAYVGNQAGIEIDPKNQAIAANFYSIPSAKEGLEKLNTVISALSRDLVVDSTKYFGRVDTTGMSAAVADAWEYYNDTEDALKAGVEAYKPVTDAWKALKDSVDAETAAEAALTTEKTKYEGQKAALKAAIENFVKVWNKTEIIDGNDTTALVNAFKEVIKARKDIFAKDSDFLYMQLSLGDDGEVKKDSAKVKFSDLTEEFLSKYNGKAEAFGGLSLLESAIDQFFSPRKTEAYPYGYLMANFYHAEGKLTAIKYEELYTETNSFAGIFFSKYYAVDSKVTTIKSGDAGYPEYIPEAVKDAINAKTAAAAAVDTAQANVTEAYRKYYTEVYGEFWGGIKGTDTATTNEKVSRKFGDVTVEAAIVKFKTPAADSLVVNFTKETFTKDYPIVSFYYIRPDFYNAKEGEFNVPEDWKLFFNIQREEELAIVMTQLLANQGWKSDFQLHRLLLTKVLWCQYAADNYSIGSEGTTKALARLQEIEAELYAEVIAAIAKQVEASEPFFAFVENLIGKECLDGIFARIDSAATVAAGFEETTTEPGDSWFKMIAKGEITSKALFTLKFEEFMCGSFGEDSTYRTAYEHMQIAKAFAGEEFADLVSDVIAAYIKAKDIKLDVEGYDNIIEKILFGTVEKVTLEEPIEFVEVAFKIVAPVVGPFLTSNFGGKIAELQDKYFTEWKEAWAQYDVASALVKAKIEQLETEKEVVDKYADAEVINNLINLANRYEHRIKVAIKKYEKDCEILAAIEAGADYRTLRKEKIEDALAEAYVALEAAQLKLDTAYEAYKQVLANHGLAE